MLNLRLVQPIALKKKQKKRICTHISVVYVLEMAVRSLHSFRFDLKCNLGD